MVGESNHDRAYLMALSAWKAFGYTSESPKILAQRIAEIGDKKGLNAAAEVIAEDCRRNGLEMSAGRVLKSLSESLERYRNRLSTLSNIENFTIQDMETIQKQQTEWIDMLKNGGNSKNRSSLPYIIFWVIIIAVILWLIL